MLDIDRIREAENNIKAYLEEGLIKKKEFNKQIFNTYLKNADESLSVAQLVSERKVSTLWVIVCSYYAMYYIANALIYQSGYKVGDKISHKITSEALIVFIRNKLRKQLVEDYEEAKEEALEIVQNKADQIIQNFDYEREKRGTLQYDMTEEVKESKGKTSLNRAKEFVNELKNLSGELS